MLRKLNVLCLSVLLITGLALIGWSIVAQDEEIQQDMEEYAALVEQVRVYDETETGAGVSVAGGSVGSSGNVCGRLDGAGEA